MRIRSLSIAVLALALATISGCEGDHPTQAPMATAPVLESDLLHGEDAVPYYTQDFLRSLWNSVMTSPCDVVTGLVDPVHGAVVTGSIPGWNSTPGFRIVVPPGAIPPPADGSPSQLVRLSILVPRAPTQFDPDWVPVFRLEPDGLAFTQPVTVTLGLPPLYHLKRAAKFYLYEIAPGVYGYSEYESWRADQPGESITSITFQTTHFSRWPTPIGK